MVAAITALPAGSKEATALTTLTKRELMLQDDEVKKVIPDGEGLSAERSAFSNIKDWSERRSMGVLAGILLLALPTLQGQETSVAASNVDLAGRWSPIVLAPGLGREITQKLFTEKDYRFAILPSSNHFQGHILAFVVREEGGVFRCYLKRVKREDVFVDNRFSPEALSESEIEIDSAVISGEAVTELSRFLRDSTSSAVYHPGPLEGKFRILDGQNFHVYVKGRDDDAYEDFSASVIDHPVKSSLSCVTICSVLAALVLENDKDPLNKLVQYFKLTTEDGADVKDPFLKDPEPLPDFVLPPLK